MKCTDCPYFWKEENEEYASCHYRWNDGYDPCEVADRYEADEEDSYEENSYDELSFDPT